MTIIGNATWHQLLPFDSINLTYSSAVVKSRIGQQAGNFCEWCCAENRGELFAQNCKSDIFNRYRSAFLRKGRSIQWECSKLVKYRLPFLGTDYIFQPLIAGWFPAVHTLWMPARHVGSLPVFFSLTKKFCHWISPILWYKAVRLGVLCTLSAGQMVWDYTLRGLSKT